MKKKCIVESSNSILSLLIVLFLGLFLLNGCGSDNSKATTMTKEEMESSATTLSLKNLDSECSKNVVAAEEKYQDSVIRVTGFIKSIESGRITIQDLNGSKSLEIVLPNDDIVNLESSQVITVIGILTSVANRKMENAFIFDENYTTVAKVVIRKVTMQTGIGYEMVDNGFLCSSDSSAVQIEFENNEDGIRNYGSGTSVSYAYDYSEINGEKVKEGDLFDISGKARCNGSGTVTYFRGVKATKHE